MLGLTYERLVTLVENGPALQVLGQGLASRIMP
jgi:hypothetical protein